MKNRLLAVLQLIIILGIIIGIPAYLILIHPEIWYNFKSIEAFDAFMERHEEQSIPIYIGCQIVQVIVTVLPGQVIQIAGGYFYGFPVALLLSLIGITIGSCAAFFIARKLGQRPMAMIFGEQRFLKYKKALDTKKAHRIIFLLYLIPGLPKDMVAYAAGVSRMRLTVFLILSMAGRFPSMAASLLMGRMLDTKSYTGAAILAVIVLAVCLVCVVKRKTIMGITDRYFEKYNKNPEAGEHVSSGDTKNDASDKVIKRK